MKSDTTIMEENKTEETMGCLLSQKEDYERYGAQYESPEGVYCNLLESYLSTDVDTPKFAAEWSERYGVVFTLSINDDGEFTGIVLDRHIRNVNSRYFTTNVEALSTVAVGKLLRDTVDFEELKRLCINSGIFSEKSLEKELLKRAVKM